MESLPNKLYLSVMDFKNRYPTLFISLVFLIVISIVMGIILNITSSKLIKNENKINFQNVLTEPDFYEGRIYYAGKNEGRDEYGLQDLSGKSIALLRVDDDRLKVIEGLYVKIYGDFLKGSGNKQNTIIVKEVIIQNVTN